MGLVSLKIIFDRSFLKEKHSKSRTFWCFFHRLNELSTVHWGQRNICYFLIGLTKSLIWSTTSMLRLKCPGKCGSISKLIAASFFSCVFTTDIHQRYQTSYTAPVIAPSVMGLNLGSLGFADHTRKSKTNAFMIFAGCAVVYACLSSRSYHSTCR